MVEAAVGGCGDGTWGGGFPEEVALELGEEEVTFAPGQMDGVGSGRAFQARDPKTRACFPLWVLNSQ